MRGDREDIAVICVDMIGRRDHSAALPEGHKIEARTRDDARRDGPSAQPPCAYLGHILGMDVYFPMSIEPRAIKSRQFLSGAGCQNRQILQGLQIESEPNKIDVLSDYL